MDLSQLSPQQRNWNYVECSPPKEPKNMYGEKMVSKCRMQIQSSKFQCRYIFKFNIEIVLFDSVNGQKVYTRHCVAEAENAERNACLVRSVLPQVKILQCETCQEDGCNAVLSEKPTELKEGDTGSAIKITSSMQLFLIVSGVAWLWF